MGRDEGTKGGAKRGGGNGRGGGGGRGGRGGWLAAWLSWGGLDWAGLEGMLGPETTLSVARKNHASRWEILKIVLDMRFSMPHFRIRGKCYF